MMMMIKIMIMLAMKIIPSVDTYDNHDGGNAEDVMMMIIMIMLAMKIIPSDDTYDNHDGGNTEDDDDNYDHAGYEDYSFR